MLEAGSGVCVLTGDHPQGLCKEGRGGSPSDSTPRASAWQSAKQGPELKDAHRGRGPVHDTRDMGCALLSYRSGFHRFLSSQGSAASAQELQKLKVFCIQSAHPWYFLGDNLHQPLSFRIVVL